MAWFNYAYAYLTSKDEEGQGMVEYGLIIALVAIVVIAALTVLGGSVRDVFTNIAGSLGGGSGGGTTT